MMGDKTQHEGHQFEIPPIIDARTLLSCYTLAVTKEFAATRLEALGHRMRLSIYRLLVKA